MRYVVNVCGFCPMQNAEFQVDVAYKQVPIMGCPAPSYKKSLHYCEYLDDHSCTERICPIVMAAPAEP